MASVTPSSPEKVSFPLNTILEGLKDGKKLVYDPKRKQFIALDKSDKKTLGSEVITKKEEVANKIYDYVKSNKLGVEDVISIYNAVNARVTRTKNYDKISRKLIPLITDQLSTAKEKFIEELKQEFEDFVDFVYPNPTRKDFKDREDQVLIAPNPILESTNGVILYYLDVHKNVVEIELDVTNFHDLEKTIESLLEIIEKQKQSKGV